MFSSLNLRGEDDDDDDEDDDGEVSDQSNPRIVLSSSAKTAMAMGQSPYKMPFRWFWMKDGGSFEPYADTVNALIETHFSLFQNGAGPARFTTPPLMRYVDDRPQTYHIDFSAMEQKNEATGFVRKLSRKAVEDASPSNCRWEVQAGSTSWKPFEDLVQGEIETAYRRYLDGKGPAVVSIKFPGRPETYSLDFVSGKQTNTETSTEKRIRRTANAAPVLSTIVFSLPKSKNLALLSDKQVIASVSRQLNEACKVALGPKYVAPQFTVDARASRATLSMDLKAAPIAGILAGIVQRCLYNFGGIHAAKLTVNGASSLTTMSNPRLMMLLSSVPPRVGLSRDDAVLFLASILVWKAKCSLYGGFVRDFIINAESANDIDCELPSSAPSEIQRVTTILRTEIVSTPIRLAGSEKKGAAHCVTFRGPWVGKDIQVDLVDPNLIRPSPGVDCDVGNLIIRPDGEISRKQPDAGGDLLPLAKCIKHCRKKQFVFFYNFDADPTMCTKRVHKYLSRGWKCLSAIPRHRYSPQIAQYSHLIVPSPKYMNKKWWMQQNP
jgi:hypothetical protein